MGFISEIIGIPLGWAMWLCYTLVRNYGVALILFTLITKVLMFPMSLKQQKSSVKMAMVKPKLDNAQKKYANNKDKLNEEMMKIYQEAGYNPMSGCLPLLIQFPILFGVINVVYNPLTHIVRLSKDVIAQAQTIAQGIEGITFSAAMPQMAIIDGVRKNASLFSSVMSPEEIDKVLNLNMSFLGIHLGEIPYLGFNVLMLIPILSGLTSFLVSMQSMKNTGETSADASANSMKTMMYIMPLMSVMFCFSLPAGVGMYWIASNVFSYLQGMIMNKKYNPTEMAEKIKAEQASQAAKERMEKIENRRKAREELMAHQAEVEAAKKANAKGKKKKVEMPEELDDETMQQALSVKEQNRRKLAEARKRDAEKYGEEYVEVTDDDLK